MPKDYKVEIDRQVCIGCQSCVGVCGKLFVMAKDGKSSLVSAKNLTPLEIDKKDFECAKSAAGICPVKCIHIFDLSTKKKLM